MKRRIFLKLLSLSPIAPSLLCAKGKLSTEIIQANAELDGKIKLIFQNDRFWCKGCGKIIQIPECDMPKDPDAQLYCMMCMRLKYPAYMIYPDGHYEMISYKEFYKA